MTAAVAQPEIEPETLPSIKSELQRVWEDYKQNTEPRGIAFGKVCCDFRATAEVVQGGTTFTQALADLGIPKSTAYFWIAEYEFASGLKSIPCDECPATFPSKTQLKKHVNKEHFKAIIRPDVDSKHPELQATVEANRETVSPREIDTTPIELKDGLRVIRDGQTWEFAGSSIDDGQPTPLTPMEIRQGADEQEYLKEETYPPLLKGYFELVEPAAAPVATPAPDAIIDLAYGMKVRIGSEIYHVLQYDRGHPYLKSESDVAYDAEEDHKAAKQLAETKAIILEDIKQGISKKSLYKIYGRKVVEAVVAAPAPVAPAVPDLDGEPSAGRNLFETEKAAQKECDGLNRRHPQLGVTQGPQKAAVTHREGDLITVDGTAYEVIDAPDDLDQMQPVCRRRKRTGEYLHTMLVKPVVTPAPEHELGGVTVENFLTPDETQTLFDACAGLKYERKKDIFGKYDVRHATVCFSETKTPRMEKAGGVFDLDTAPPAIKSLAKRLTSHAGIDINYLSVVRYEDGHDFMNAHQHKEDKDDKPEEMRVWIVSSGAERPLRIQKLLGWRDTKKGKKPILGDRQDIIATAGSLITLPSEFNLTHFHAVPEFKKCKTVRYAVNCKHIPQRRPQVYDCHAGKKYPADAVYVGCRTENLQGLVREGTVFGNAVRPLERRGRTNPAIAADEKTFKDHALHLMENLDFRKQVEGLRGRDLLCWCKPDVEFCHARVWLELANN